MTEPLKTPRRGTAFARSAFTLGAAGVLGVAGCRTVDGRAQAVPGSPSVVSVYPAHSSALVSPPQADADQQPADYAVDLEVALRLAGVENPTINLAREAICEAQAEQKAAQALLLPTVNVGGNFNLHRGNLQTGGGSILDVSRQSLYLGAGAQAVGSGTVTAPGVRLFAHLGDAAYEPLAARQRVAARRADAAAVRNDTLLDVATAYLELVGAEGRVRLLTRGEADMGEVVRLTAAYARAGQGRSADANRAAANAQLLARETQAAGEELAVAAARLGRLLSLAPAVRLRTPAGAIPTIRLVPADAEVPSLIATALRNRPEVSARSAEVGLAQVRRRQESVRPLLPVVSVGFSGGAFGGGSNRTTSDFGPLTGRTDFDVLAAWNVENLGFGNRARVRRADSGVAQAVSAFDLTAAAVRREVAEAHAQSEAAARQVETTTAAVTVAEEGFRLESARVQQAQGRPLEVLDSFRQLLDARLGHVRAVVAFDAAQFRLFAAVGSTPCVPDTP